MAEHSAVNRRVVGSSPTCGAKILSKLKEKASRESGLLCFVMWNVTHRVFDARSAPRSVVVVGLAVMRRLLDRGPTFAHGRVGLHYLRRYVARLGLNNPVRQSLLTQRGQCCVPAVMKANALQSG
jgi:hypothetical protein